MTPVLFATMGTFVLVASGMWLAVTRWAEGHSPEKRRLHALLQGPGIATVPLEQGLVSRELDPFFARLTLLLPQKGTAAASHLALRLARAGYTSPHVALYYSLAQLALPIVAALAVVLFVPLHFVYAIPAAAIGYLLPNLYVDQRIRARQRAIRNGLPDALDLLTLCVEAGAGLDQAISKTAEELDITHPLISEQLRMVTTEIRAGRPRLEAFANFATRTGLEEVRSLASMLTQTDRFGTSIGQALRTHAETTRTIRRQRAEERAAKVGVKLVFPLALCLFPALYLVVFGPTAIRLIRAFF